MGAHYLSRLFSPRSIAVIGASERQNSVGMRVFANLIEAGFEGQLYPVNPKHDTVQGKPCHPSVSAIGHPVDLAVIATPAETVPDIIHECGEYGVAAAIILSAGFAESGPKGERLQNNVLESARHHGLRLVGPNCLGIMRPSVGMNATFSKNDALPGNLALVSQSGALCTAILDWAESRQIGFSAVASLGDAADVDFGEVLDYLALDPKTHSILLYVEGIRHARRFMSGLRAAARMKPVVVIKSGRHAEGSRAAMSHTGALVGGDDVFDAALERAGVVRATTVTQLFSAAQMLASGSRIRKNRLAIITNGGGPGVMATDRAVEMDVKMAELGPATMKRLDGFLPDHWSHGNPVDILGDAGPERYRDAVDACMRDDNVDGVLVMLTPQAMTDPLSAAEGVMAGVNAHKKPVLTCWMGEKQVEGARELFASKRIPHYPAPESAVEAFAYLATYHRNQELLVQVPESLGTQKAPDVEGARLIIERVMAEGRRTLSLLESKAILRAFQIPVAQAVMARTPQEALVAAESLGFPVAMKISAPTLTHKSDIGGVRLNIANAQAVRSVFNEMMESAKAAAPNAAIEGITVEPMVNSRAGRELMLGVIRDPVFGPVISFGAGGTAVEIHRDRAVELPPLNAYLAQRLIKRTRISKLLGPFRNLPAVDFEALERALLRISEMVCELPEIREMDINPLIADENGTIAVDARIGVDYPPTTADRYAHMAIHPYPVHLTEDLQLPDGTNIRIRPIRPEDAEIEQSFVRNLSEQAKYMRFMQALQELTPEMLVRFTQIDYDREMAFIAVTQDEGEETEIGVARYTIQPDGDSCEFAIVVADAWHHKGIGSHLMDALMRAARAKGVQIMEGEVLAQNRVMLNMVERLGFQARKSHYDDDVISVRRRL